MTLYWAFFFGASLFSVEQDRLFWHLKRGARVGSSDPWLPEASNGFCCRYKALHPLIYSAIHPSIHPPIYPFIYPSTQPCMHACVHPTNTILLRADFMHVLGEILRMQFWANSYLLFPTTPSWRCCLVLYQSCVAVYRSSARPHKELPFPHHFLPGQMEPAYLANLLSCWPLSVPSLWSPFVPCTAVLHHGWCTYKTLGSWPILGFLLCHYQTLKPARLLPHLKSCLDLSLAVLFPAGIRQPQVWLPWRMPYPRRLGLQTRGSMRLCSDLLCVLKSQCRTCLKEALDQVSKLQIRSDERKTQFLLVWAKCRHSAQTSSSQISEYMTLAKEAW